MTFDAVQRRNGKAVLETVSDFARAKHWDARRTFRVAHMVLMCIITESNMRVLANPNVPDSLKIPHDGLGHDHASVGLFQQQVPMWGSAHDCMSIPISTGKFLHSLDAKGLTVFTLHPPVPNWLRIQRVQGSAYADGSNYEKHRYDAMEFLKVHWNYHKMDVR